MAYELLSQSRKINKREGGGGGVALIKNPRVYYSQVNIIQRCTLMSKTI